MEWVNVCSIIIQFDLLHWFFSVPSHLIFYICNAKAFAFSFKISFHHFVGRPDGAERRRWLLFTKGSPPPGLRKDAFTFSFLPFYFSCLVKILQRSADILHLTSHIWPLHSGPIYFSIFTISFYSLFLFSLSKTETSPYLLPYTIVI